jgi:hypothetical protein
LGAEVEEVELQAVDLGEVLGRVVSLASTRRQSWVVAQEPARACMVASGTPGCHR